MFKKIIKGNGIVVLFLLLVTVTIFFLFVRNDSLKSGDGFRKAHVVKVIDGDTIELLSGERVRYLGINAPEKGSPWSVESREYNRDLVESKDVRLLFDQEKYDHYGRILAYVYVDQTFVNEAIILEGLANSYIVPPNNLYEYDLENAEVEAKTERRGIWSVLD
jgi:micrococcal nuclease